MAQLRYAFQSPKKCYLPSDRRGYVQIALVDRVISKNVAKKPLVSFRELIVSISALHGQIRFLPSHLFALRTLREFWIRVGRQENRFDRFPKRC